MATERINRSIPETDVLEVLYRTPCGYIDELENKIGVENVRQLEAIGYIVNAPSEKGYTYQISKRAKQIVSDFFGKMTIRDYLSDLYYTYIRRVSFSIK